MADLLRGRSCGTRPGCRGEGRGASTVGGYVGGPHQRSSWRGSAQTSQILSAEARTRPHSSWSYAGFLRTAVTVIGVPPSLDRVGSWSMRSTRSRHSSSYWSSRRRATRSDSRLVRTTFRRPMRCLWMRPARSRSGHVLLHGREAHRVVAGISVGGALLPIRSRPAANDVPPGSVTESPEDPVVVDERAASHTTIRLYSAKWTSSAGRTASWLVMEEDHARVVEPHVHSFERSRSSRVLGTTVARLPPPSGRAGCDTRR